MKNWRRYEILLPRRFNDGRRVPKALLAKTILELAESFNSFNLFTLFSPLIALQLLHSGIQ